MIDFEADSNDPGLVETPESRDMVQPVISSAEPEAPVAEKPARARRPRRPKAAEAASEPGEDTATNDTPEAAE